MSSALRFDSRPVREQLLLATSRLALAAGSAGGIMPQPRTDQLGWPSAQPRPAKIFPRQLARKERGSGYDSVLGHRYRVTPMAPRGRITSWQTRQPSPTQTSWRKSWLLTNPA